MRGILMLFCRIRQGGQYLGDQYRAAFIQQERFNLV